MTYVWLGIGVLGALVATIIGGLLWFSAEEEQRALEEWERMITTHRRAPDQGGVWGEDDDAA